MSSHDLPQAQAFLTEHMPRLRGYLRIMTGNREDADDILQEVCVKYLRSGPLPGTPQARSWLFSACRNRALNLSRDRARRHQREREYVNTFDPGDAGPLRGSDRLENLSRIEECMGKMPHALREVLYLNVAVGQSVREISDQTGIPKSTVAVRVREALVLLNRCFHQES